jgi:hypothetical protein
MSVEGIQKKCVKGQQTKGVVVVVGITNGYGEKERDHYWYYR